MSFIDAALYNEIIAVLPIACVDIVALNDKDQILLVQRLNEPAKGEWWFPGGRVNKGEKRTEAVQRILLKECSLSATWVKELETLDVIQEEKHGITTVFIVKAAPGEVIPDDQSSSFKWLDKKEYPAETLNEFVSGVINKIWND